MSFSIIINENLSLLSFIPRHVFAVGRITPSGCTLLGTAFAIAENKFATTKHVTSGDDNNLVLIMPKNPTLADYQDTSDQQINYFSSNIIAIDPFRDICILASDQVRLNKLSYRLSGTDELLPGSSVTTFGFPHADSGRLVLTQQDTCVGARVLIEAGGIKSKHIVLNTQARPGQSGGPVINTASMSVIGMLIGSYAPGGGGFMSLGGVDPSTLHQTTHVISTEYLKEMM